jgi:hypothetical protein
MLRIILSVITLFGGIILHTCLFLYKVAAQPEKQLHIGEIAYRYTGNAFYKDPADSGKGNPAPVSRVIFAMNDSIASCMTAVLDSSIRRKWQCSKIKQQLKVLHVSGFLQPSLSDPFYKPKAPKTGSNENYLFVRVLDAGSYEWEGNYFKQWEQVGVILFFDCRILNTGTGKTGFSRNMKVTFVRRPVPQEEYPLYKMPGLPDDFMAAFRKAAAVFFAPENPPESMELEIQPACLYIDLKKEKQVKIPLHFFIGPDGIDITGGRDLWWKQGNARDDREKTRLHIMRNVIKVGMLNRPAKITQKIIRRIPVYFMGDTLDNLLTIPYSDEFTGELLTSRSIEGECLFTIGPDTVARFGFANAPVACAQDTARFYWDGNDTATIRPLAFYGTNRGLYKPTVLKGILFNKTFVIQNAIAGHMLDITYDNRLIATINLDNGEPLQGYLYYADLTPESFRILMVLASIPFAYYGE